MTAVEQEISPTNVIHPGQEGGAAPATRAAIPAIYIGDLDPQVTEDEVLNLFRHIGPILSVRICRDIITRRSLGYGYVNFQNHADAEKALETMNYTALRGRQIRLMWQHRDPAMRYSGSGNVFVRNLPEIVDHQTLHDLFSAFGSILSCKVMKDEDGKSRRYGFVHFKEETNAKKAIEDLHGKQPSVKDATEAQKNEFPALHVANFIRRNARIAALLQNFTNVYIKHVLPNVEKKDIEAFFKKFGGITSSITKADRRGRVFAFCDFSEHKAAQKAIEQAHDKPANGLTDTEQNLYVQRAQSRSERLVQLRQVYMQRQSMGNNLYVRNFDAEYTSEQLMDLFKGFGDVVSARVMTDENGVSRGFGFVCFKTSEQANVALKEVNGRMLNGKPLIVNIAQRRDHRTSMLQIQFQQRLQAMMQRLPMGPFVMGPYGWAGQGQKGGQRGKRPAQQGQRGGSQQPKKTSKPNTPAAKPTKSPAVPPLPAGLVPPSAEATVRVTAAKQPEEAEMPPLAPLTAQELMDMAPDDQKVALGERLYVKIHEIDAEHAPKITGMLLEMEALEAYALLSNATELHSKVDEALCVLRAAN